jgi:hypothetical protein
MQFASPLPLQRRNLAGSLGEVLTFSGSIDLPGQTGNSVVLGHNSWFAYCIAGKELWTSPRAATRSKPIRGA